MAWTQEAADARDLLLGYSPEYINNVRHHTNVLRRVLDARGPPPVYQLASSDSEYSDDGALPSPPKSPKHDGPDLSTKAWHSRKWGDRSLGIEPKDSGFDNFQYWQSTVKAEHAAKTSTTFGSSSKSDVATRKCRSTVNVSNR